MKLHASQILLCFVLSFALTGIASAQGPRGKRGGPPSGQPPGQAGVYTTVSGAISQLNYDRDAEVEGFLLSNNTLVHLPPRAAPRIGASLHTGDTVQIAGLAHTSPAGRQTVQAQSIQDRTSGKAFTIPQPGAAAPYSGSGRIQQLNYGADGAVNGFLLENGTLVTVPSFAASNPSSIRVGVSVAYSGYARTTMSGRTVVDAQTLNINGQALALGSAGPLRGPAGAPPPPPAAPAAPVDVAPGDAAPSAPAPPPAPAERTDQPPPPPPPPAGPPQS